MLSTPLLADYFRQFQELAKRVSDTLHMPLEELEDAHHELIGILHTLTTSRISLLINGTILDPAKMIW